MGYSHGRKWTNEKIEEALLSVVKLLKLDHFPTHSEIICSTGDMGLTNAISKHGGTRHWADKMGMKILGCESEFGNDFELLAIKDINEFTGLQSIQTKPRYPYDLYTNDCIKIDVKASMPLRDRKYDSWAFNLEKKQPTCDVFIFYCVDKDAETIKRKYIIPSCVLSGNSHVGICNLSRYDNYLNRWDYISSYNDFFLNIKRSTGMIPKRRTCS